MEGDKRIKGWDSCVTTSFGYSGLLWQLSPSHTVYRGQWVQGTFHHVVVPLNLPLDARSVGWPWSCEFCFLAWGLTSCLTQYQYVQLDFFLVNSFCWLDYFPASDPKHLAFQSPQSHIKMQLYMATKHDFREEQDGRKCLGSGSSLEVKHMLCMQLAPGSIPAVSNYKNSVHRMWKISSWDLWEQLPAKVDSSALDGSMVF